MVRDILNHLGEKIGEMDLPDDTSEEVWQQKLAFYAKAPPSEQEQLLEMLSRTVSRSREIADEIIEEFKRSNLQYFAQNNIPNDLAIMISIHVHHRLRAVQITVGGLPFTIDLMNLVVSGDLETAWVVLGLMEPDDMSMPFHFLSADKITALRAMIGDRVGLA